MTNDRRDARYVQERGIRTDQFEFEMLLECVGVCRSRSSADGYRLRLYVPYGAAWYPYFMRRLAERPAECALPGEKFLQVTSGRLS